MIIDKKCVIIYIVFIYKRKRGENLKLSFKENMDMIVNEKIRIRDIFASLKEIISGTTSNVNEEKINKRLQEIYCTQSELGATASIAALEKDVQNHSTKVKVTRRHATKIEAKANSVKTINEERDKAIEEENSLEL